MSTGSAIQCFKETFKCRIYGLIESYNQFLEQLDEHTQCGFLCPKTL